MKNIPEADMKAINDSFKRTGAVETLGKNAFGRVVDARKQVVNEKTITLQDFSGRFLRHQKSVVILGRGQLVIGVKGQRYDDISLEMRKSVVWDENDFD
jgi:hypothetical protein